MSAITRHPPQEGQRGALPAEWRVELPTFEGPLDLLLHLLKVNEVDIFDIPVATICDQFHQYLGLMDELNLDIAGEYIYEAALLIQLKSRMLLPIRPDPETGEVEDPREDLVQRLLEYQRLRDAAQSLAEIDSVRSGMFVRRDDASSLAADERELDMEEVTYFDLLLALRQTLQRYRSEHPDPIRFLGEQFSVREQIERLLGALRAGRPYDVVHDLTTRSCRAEAIAAFLALLELGRLQAVRLHQSRDGQILMYRTARRIATDELEAIQ